MAVRVVFDANKAKFFSGSGRAYGLKNIGSGYIGSNDIKIGMTKLIDGIQPALEVYAREMAYDIHTYMVENHRWKNRRGVTEANLYAKVIVSDQKYVSTIRIGYNDCIKHAVYLEEYYGGKYALINPTIRKWGPIVMNGLYDFMTRMGLGSQFMGG